MTRLQLLRRNLTYFWRTNLAVVAGVAVAVAVLAGALLVGDAVRASLRDLVLLRLGETSFVITSEGFFREQLAAGLDAQPEFRRTFRAAVPIIALDSVVTHEKSRRRASGVLVYGVDARFWQFHGRNAQPPEDRDVLASASLAEELGAAPGDTLILRVEKPSAVPVDSLHSHKDDLGRTLRLRLRQSLAADALGEFAVRPQQGAVRAVFVSLARLQRDLGQAGRANGILVSDNAGMRLRLANSETKQRELQRLLRESFTVDDLGVRVVEAQNGRLKPAATGAALSVESDRIILDNRIADATRAAAAKLGWESTAVFTYLANSIRIGTREIPYSLVTGLDGAEFGALPGSAVSTEPKQPSIWLNEWAWRALGAQVGDIVTLGYYVWQEGGRLETRTTQFVLRGRVPMDGLGGDRSLAPTFPGIAESPTLTGWNPPFPIDLKRIRPADEAYWKQYRTTPKAFISLAVGQRLWQTRYGKLTAVRLMPPSEMPVEAALSAARRELREALDPVAAGITVYAARDAGTQASHGAVDFSLYFVYFSFFLVISAVLLASLFFRLGIEQRLREIGLLETLGYSAGDVRRLFLSEGVVLALAGSVLGAAGAVAYGKVMVYGLRTWWVGAVGTTFLRLEVSSASLLIGIAGGILAAVACIAWTLRSLRAFSPRSLVTGAREAAPLTHAERKRPWRWGLAAAILALALLAASGLGKLDAAGGFFGAGGLLLASLLSFQWGWLGERKRPPADRRAGRAQTGASVVRLGFRNASWRPGRSLLCMALVATATFILVAVDAFRRNPQSDTSDPHSGTGGFPLLAESLVPIAYDLNTRAGREGLNLTGREIATLEGVRFFSFRLRPGDDASCLNLYQPRNPRILGVPQDLVAASRFSFQSSQARTPEERGNPWRLLGVELPDGAIPAIADANTMTYILQRKLGEDFVIEHAGRPIRLRLVAALADSMFQSELLISEENFRRLFPNQPGYRFFLLGAQREKSATVAAALEEGLSDFGYDVMPAGERLAAFHRVENTYISTFQALGGLGLLLGTWGLAAVMLRNVLERRRELALLRAVGFRPADLASLVVVENSLLLFGGLATGVLSAIIAILPALVARGGVSATADSVGIILAGVVLTGLMASVVAVGAVLRAPLLAALRSE